MLFQQDLSLCRNFLPFCWNEQIYRFSCLIDTKRGLSQMKIQGKIHLQCHTFSFSPQWIIMSKNCSKSCIRVASRAKSRTTLRLSCKIICQKNVVICRQITGTRIVDDQTAICKSYDANNLRHKIERINTKVSSGERDAGPPKSRPACGKRVLYPATDFFSSPFRCNLRTVLSHEHRKTGQAWSGRPSGRERWTHSCFPGPAGFESRFPCL